MRGVTYSDINFFVTPRISIHTPHAGSDSRTKKQPNRKLRFQSTLPMRGVTPYPSNPAFVLIISIHTPHAGSDCSPSSNPGFPDPISIHTPHAGSDKGNFCHRCGQRLFQSTLPMRGVTSSNVMIRPPSVNFNPHSPCGE